MSFTLNDLDNPLIKRGMTAQLATRRARIAAGETPLGWKVGMGSPASMQKLGLQAPLLGYLMQRALLAPGSTISLKGYSKPVMEPEIAVRMARDLAAGATAAAAAAAIKEIAPAIEIADLDPAPTPDNLDRVLADDIFQRHVVLGAATRAGSATSGLTSRLIRRGRGSRAQQRSGSADRQAARYRRACRQCGGGIRRKTLGWRSHHHRLDHAAGIHRTGRNRDHARDRSDRCGLGAFFARLRAAPLSARPAPACLADADLR